MSDITFLEDVIMAQSQSDEAAMSVTENVLSEIFDGLSSKQSVRGMTIETPCDDAKTRDEVLLFPEDKEHCDVRINKSDVSMIVQTCTQARKDSASSCTYQFLLTALSPQMHSARN